MLKFISHDFYVKKKRVGLAFSSGVTANYRRDLYLPFIQASFAKYLRVDERTYFIPSLLLGFYQPLKEYSIFFRDEITNVPQDDMEPGLQLLRISELAIGSGMLLANYDGSIGLSGRLQHPVRKSKFESTRGEASYQLLVHAEKIFSYYHRGLLSRKYLLRPRAVLHFSNKSSQFFGELMVQRKRFEVGLGVLPNFTSRNERLSFNLGYDFNHFKINYLGSVLNEGNRLNHPLHTVYLSVIFPELKRYGIPVPAIIRNL